MSEYVELHAHSSFSLLDGASHPEELAARAAELGMPALALTDHDAVYGAVRFAQAAQTVGVRPIHGAELTLSDGAHLTLLVESKAGWDNLCWLISRARHHAPKGEAALPSGALDGHTAGLIALSGCRRGRVTAALLRRDFDGAVAAAAHYAGVFGAGRFFIETQHLYRPGDDQLVQRLASLAEYLKLGVVATNNVHYATPERHSLQDVLASIRHNTPLSRRMPQHLPNAEAYLKTGVQLTPRFACCPEAVGNTVELAGRCTFELGYGLQDLPRFPTPAGLSAAGLLAHLCKQAFPARYGTHPARAVTRRLEGELNVIERGGLANYFLIVWDIVRYARANGIRCQGRGSAANSLVAYLLGITPIDPLAHDLVFERFLSDERRIIPDIDIDFDAARREEVIQYVYERHGYAHAAMASTFVTFRARSAIRDVGKALGLPLALVDSAARAVDRRTFGDVTEPPDEDVPPLPAQAAELTAAIQGFPRHLGIHNGGMVLTGAPITTRVPVEPATMPDRYVVQWDKDSLEDAGLVKIDLLGLRMLSVLSETVALVEGTTGERIDLDGLAFDDPAVYDLLCCADTVGVFQVESRAQTQILPRLKPRSFADIVVSISLIRPGPLQGNMVHPYLRRRLGEEPVRYLHPLLEGPLAETLGVIIYQEQVLKVAEALAGFTRGQGEVLRRALSSKDSHALLGQLHDAFVGGAQRKGVPTEAAEAAFDALRAFGGYSFPKSHAAAFAVLVYQSAWLKVYHPAAFAAALLNNQPMGFWSPAVIVNDARRHGIEVRKADANCSDANSTLEDGAIRIGLASVKGLGDAGAGRMVEARGRWPFTGLKDLCRRTRLPRRLVENLLLAGTCDTWGVPRRRLLWELGQLRYQVDELDLASELGELGLPPLGEAGRLAYEIGYTGVATGDHPMAFYRERLRAQGIISSAELNATPSGQRVRAAGLVVMRQAPPTAKGFRFLTLEDEEGMMNVIVKPQVYEQQRHVFRSAALLVVSGRVQREGAVVNLVAENARGL